MIARRAMMVAVAGLSTIGIASAGGFPALPRALRWVRMPSHRVVSGTTGPAWHAADVPVECDQCLPGVYRTEIENFRGNGFVARSFPWVESRNTAERAGFPQRISGHAESSYEQNYTGYYVGGGVPIAGGPGFRRRRSEGTWGWDYEHLGFRRRVNLLFSRGRLYQDGDGQYEADPPYEIPNVFGIRYGERLHDLFGHGPE